MDAPMSRNVEIKARVADLTAVEKRVAPLAQDGPIVIEQEDAFFHCPHGRLKLRRVADARSGELIAYDRPDAAGPKESQYVVHRTSDPDGLREALARALGLRGIIRKRRTLYLIGPTRVHLDRVEGLGDFVELEVVLEEGQDAQEGAVIARQLMHTIGILEDNLLQMAYMDMIEQRRKECM
jgi:adenylate cyclase